MTFLDIEGTRKAIQDALNKTAYVGLNWPGTSAGTTRFTGPVTVQIHASAVKGGTNTASLTDTALANLLSLDGTLARLTDANAGVGLWADGFKHGQRHALDRE